MDMEVIATGKGLPCQRIQTNRDWAIETGKSLWAALELARECGESADALAKWLDAPHVPTDAEVVDILADMVAGSKEIRLALPDRAAIAIALERVRAATDAMKCVCDHLANGDVLLLRDGVADIAAMASFMKTAVRWQEREAGKAKGRGA